MLDLAYTAQFKKDVKCKRRQGADLKKLDAVITVLRKGEKLPERLYDHPLVGNKKGHRECHVEPDWLLVYRVDAKRLVLMAVRTGSHADLFGV